MRIDILTKNFFKLNFSIRHVLIIIAAILTTPLLNFSIPVNAQETLDITEFKTSTIFDGPYDITSGPDGNLWFTEYYGGKIGQITPNGVITQFPTPTGESFPQGITPGPDGNIWFTELGVNKIGRITTSGIFTEFLIPTNNSGPAGITIGPDGNIWFTEYHGNKIGRITTNGIINEFTIPTPDSRAYRITAGPDGNLWFTEQFGNKIGRITPTGIITEFSIGLSQKSPYGITTGPDGNIWFTEDNGNRIGRITPAGNITEFSVASEALNTLDITAGPDGNLWFTIRSISKSEGRIGKITTSGIVTTYPVINDVFNDLFFGITTGPDDNIWFTEIVGRIGRVNLSDTEDILNVPYFSQNVSPWGPSEYDHAQFLGFPNITMDRWGCAVTSAAMVLNYHGMTQFADNSPLDPGSLNQWLKHNNGYLTGTDADGPYSYLSWPAISKLTEDLFEASKSAVKLMHNRATPSASTTTLLNEDLTVGKFPDILWVKNASTSGHFVVAKGIVNETYAINDPEWNVPFLSSFDNNYMQVDRYIPSNTNLSYIVVVVNPSVETLVSDPLGRRTGKYLHNGQTQTFNEIPNANYSFQDPISNPNDLGIGEQLGTGVNEFLLPEPPDGNYSITLSSSKNTSYTINFAAYEDSGDNTVDKLEGTVAPNIDDVLDLHYSQTQSSLTNRSVSFQSTIDDINETRSLNLIDSDHLANHLIRIINQAQEHHEKGNIDLALKKLDHFEDTINRKRGKEILETAYQILFYDADYLKKTI